MVAAPAPPGDIPRMRNPPALVLALAGSACLLPARAIAQWAVQRSGSTASLRGISVPSAAVAWASGARGTVLRTTDGGATWVARPVPGADSLDFRDVEALDAERAWVLSIGPGEASRIYGTTDGGATWTLQFRNTDSTAFYDCITFWNPRHGIAMSDPANGRFRLVETRDGATWRAVPVAEAPEAEAGEGGFAASGTCLVARPDDDAADADRELVWLATGGGARARVLRSSDAGHSWTAADTPLPAGASPKGVFGLAMRDRAVGVAVGGNYEAPDDSSSVVAITRDGGTTWVAPRGRQPGGYRSGVAFVPGSGGRVLVAVGTSGSDLSLDGGESWNPGDTLSLNAVAFAPERAGPARALVAAGWAVGPRGTIAKWAGPIARRGKD